MIGAVLVGEEEARKWFKGLMNSKETAEFLGISKYALRKLLKEDKIPYSKTFNNISFHQNVLNAWLRGEFIGGRIALVLDKETIESDHREALRQQFQRYPHLKQMAEALEVQTRPFANIEYGYDVRQDGVHLTIGANDTGILFKVFLTHTALDELFSAVQKFRAKS